jgi:hypothetical protein
MSPRRTLALLLMGARAGALGDRVTAGAAAATPANGSGPAPNRG